MTRVLGSLAALVGAVTAALVVGTMSAATASSNRTIAVNADFAWHGVRNCDAQRPGSVMCIAAQARVAGLGLVEYARDAVPNGQTTTDGCPEYSTQGTIWVSGGTAKFDGAPAPTCGAQDSPDAHYTLTLHGGAGVLSGATGTADVVADNGVDRWHGSIALAGSGGSQSGLVIGGVAGGVVVAGVAATVWLRRKNRQPANTA